MRKDASFVSVATAVGLVGAALSGGLYMGALASDVETLEEAQKIVQEDHDRLITVENEVKHVKAAQVRIEENVKLILTAVNKINDREE